jgi:hypothetical protein
MREVVRAQSGGHAESPKMLAVVTCLWRAVSELGAAAATNEPAIEARRLPRTNAPSRRGGCDERTRHRGATADLRAFAIEARTDVHLSRTEPETDFYLNRIDALYV